MFDDIGGIGGIDPRAGPPAPRHPASNGRLSAMVTVILRAIYSREADRGWEMELTEAIRGLGDDDRWRLQVELDRRAGRVGGGDGEPGGAIL